MTELVTRSALELRYPRKRVCLGRYPEIRFMAPKEIGSRMIFGTSKFVAMISAEN